MAGSRLDKIGTIFSRATGLLQSGAIKYQDRPLWYDIYRVFPPKYEPYIEREPEKSSEIPQILYQEDVIRANFFKRFGLNPQGEVRKLADPATEEVCQSFVKRCMEIEKTRKEFTTEQVFNAATEDYLRTRAASKSLQDENISGAKESDKPSVPLSAKEKRTPIITVETLKSLFSESEQSESKVEDSKKDT